MLASSQLSSWSSSWYFREKTFCGKVWWWKRWIIVTTCTWEGMWRKRPEEVWMRTRGVFNSLFTQCNCTQRRCRVCDCGCAPIRLIVGADASYIAAIAVQRHCNTSVEYSVNIYLWRLEALWKPGFKGPRSTGQESWNFTINAIQCHAIKSTNSNELRGMTVTSGVVTISKDSGNLIGISIGGGAPLCPCLYIVQVGQCWYIYKIKSHNRCGTVYL